MNPIRKTIIAGGSTLSYLMLGHGPTVMLIHGFAEDHTIWEDQIHALSEHYCCIVPDLFGSGHSKNLDESHVRSLDDIAFCLKEILIAEKKEKIHLFGHSMGGYITLAFAEHFPAFLESFGLIHSTTYADNDEKKTMRSKIIQYWKAHGSQETQKNSVPGLFAEKNRLMPRVAKQIKIAEQIATGNMIAYYRFIMERPDRTHVLMQTVLPVLIVAGKWDPAVPYMHSIEQIKHPSNGEIHLLEHSGHMGMIEETDKINQILRNFLTRISKR